MGDRYNQKQYEYVPKHPQNQQKSNNKPDQSQKKDKFTLIRNTQGKDLQSWTKYLQSYDIITECADENNALVFLELDSDKHLLVSDFLELYELKKLNYKWYQEYGKQFNQMLNILQTDIKKQKLPFYEVNFENLCFVVQFEKLFIIQLIPLRVSQNQLNLNDYLENFLSQIQLKQGIKTAKSLLEIIKDAQSFVKPKTQIPVEGNKRSRLQSCLLQRLTIKMQWNQQMNELSKVEESLRQIFNYIENLSDSVVAQYIQQNLLEQPYTNLEEQVKYVKNQSQESLSKESLNVELQENIELVKLKNIISNQILRAQQIYNDWEGINIDENKLLKELQDYPQQKSSNQKKEAQKKPLQLSKSQIQIFFEELPNIFWIFSKFKQGNLFQATLEAIQNFHKKQESFFIDNLENSKAYRIVLNQMICQLQVQDEYGVISRILEEYIDQIIEIFSVYICSKITKGNSKQINDAVKLLKAELFNEKQGFLELLKQNFNFQNDILVSIYNKLKMTFVVLESQYQQVKDNDFEKKSREKFEQLMNLQFNGQLDEQILILQENFKAELAMQMKQQEDYQFLENCIEGNDLKQFTNPLCKNEKIMLTTNFRIIIRKIRTCWPYYFTLRNKISQLLPLEGNNQINISDSFEKIRQQVLCVCFRRYALEMQENVFNLYFLSQQLQQQISASIASQLKQQLQIKIQQDQIQREKKKNEEINLQINQKIANLQNLYSEAYIPFEVIEQNMRIVLSSQIDERSQILKYQEISEQLQLSENTDFQLFICYNQQKYQDWKLSQEKTNIFYSLKGQDPRQWNVDQLKQNIEYNRFVFFLPERKYYKLKTAITQIHNAYNHECFEILNKPPHLEEFDLNTHNKIPIDNAISVDINERLFTISDEFLEQVYQFYEEQIKEDLQKQLE